MQHELVKSNRRAPSACHTVRKVVCTARCCSVCARVRVRLGGGGGDRTISILMKHFHLRHCSI